MTTSGPTPPPALPPTTLPAFDANGNLPAGDYWPSEADFEARFVGVPASTTRPEIYKGFQRHKAALLAEGVPTNSPCLLDGGYSTNSLDPKDIDIAVEVEESLFNTSTQLRKLLSGPNAKPTYSCDAYPVLVLPAGHAHFDAVTTAAREYWRKWFGRDRAGNAKGLIWSAAGGFR